MNLSSGCAAREALIKDGSMLAANDGSAAIRTVPRRPALIAMRVGDDASSLADVRSSTATALGPPE